MRLAELREGRGDGVAVAEGGEAVGHEHDACRWRKLIRRLANAIRSRDEIGRAEGLLVIEDPFEREPRVRRADCFDASRRLECNVKWDDVRCGARLLLREERGQEARERFAILLHAA